MRSSVFTLFPPVVRGTLVLTGWSRHCRITAGLASMDVPLLVSLLSLSAGGAVRGSTAPVGWSGVSPYFAYCPSSSVPKRSSFGTSASGFHFKSSRWGHPSGSGLSQSSIGSKALAPPSWCMLRVFAIGPPVGSWFVPDLDRNGDLLAHLPLWLVSGLRDGVTHFGSRGSFLRPRSERRLPPFISP